MYEIYGDFCFVALHKIYEMRWNEGPFFIHWNVFIYVSDVSMRMFIFSVSCCVIKNGGKRGVALLNLVNDPFWPKAWHILTKIRESYVIKLSEICVDNDEKKILE